MSDTVPSTHPSIALPAGEDLWVFGYGSLMWKPGFTHEEKVPAMLRGGHRALCILSTHYRGTPEVPGLVLGLVQGGSCRGVAFRVASAQASATLDYLTEREQVTSVYKERWRMLSLNDGRRVRALAYFADPLHPQYVRLSREEIVQRVRRAHGRFGSCREYVLSTLTTMREIGVQDHSLDWLEVALAASA